MNMEVFNKCVQYIVFIDRTFILSKQLIEELSGKKIKNELIYHQILLSNYGLIAYLCSFTETTILGELINCLKNNRNLFLKNSKKFSNYNPELQYTSEQLAFDRQKAIILEKQFDKIFQAHFPCSVAEGRYNLKDQDFELLKDKIKCAYIGIKAIRDKSVAHWDKKQPELSFSLIDDYIAYLKDMVSDLIYLVNLSDQSFSLLGEISSINDTKEYLYQSIVSK